MTTNTIKRPNFGGIRTGRGAYKTLEHKDGRKFDDVDYFELLGRKCIEMDKKNTTNLPTNYGRYSKECVDVAKEVVKGIDNGMTHEELNAYLVTCVCDYPQDE